MALSTEKKCTLTDVFLYRLNSYFKTGIRWQRFFYLGLLFAESSNEQYTIGSINQ